MFHREDAPLEGSLEPRLGFSVSRATGRDGGKVGFRLLGTESFAGFVFQLQSS